MTDALTQLKEALVEPDTLDDLECYYQNTWGIKQRCEFEFYRDYFDCKKRIPAIYECNPYQIPYKSQAFGVGGPFGLPVIAFSSHYVYVRVMGKAGGEWFTAIPRNPENMGKWIPWLG